MTNREAMELVKSMLDAAREMAEEEEDCGCTNGCMEIGIDKATVEALGTVYSMAESYVNRAVLNARAGR